jgi:hypothetical protein
MKKLTRNQIVVLSDVESGYPYRAMNTPREIASRQRTLHSLEDRGLVEWRSEHWGMYWRLTDYGRSVLKYGQEALV